MKILVPVNVNDREIPKNKKVLLRLIEFDEFVYGKRVGDDFISHGGGVSFPINFDLKAVWYEEQDT